MWVQSLGQEDLPQDEMAAHSSNLVWKIPWTEEPDGLQFLGHKESDITSMHAFEQGFLSQVLSEWF